MVENNDNNSVEDRSRSEDSTDNFNPVTKLTLTILIEDEIIGKEIIKQSKNQINAMNIFRGIRCTLTEESLTGEI